MSLPDPFQNQTDNIYKDVSHDVNQLVDNSPNAPHLIVIGETHTYAASGNVELSALEAASRRMGEKNVVLAIELPQDALDIVINNFKHNPDWLNAPSPSAALDDTLQLKNMGALHAIHYAMTHHIQIVAVDSYLTMADASISNNRIVDVNESREAAMKKNIASAAGPLANSDKPPFVIAIVGRDHLSGLMDISENATAEQIKNRFSSTLEKRFGQENVLMYDASQYKGDKEPEILAKDRSTIEKFNRDENRFLLRTDTGIMPFNLFPLEDADPKTLETRIQNAADRIDGKPKEAKHAELSNEMKTALEGISHKLQIAGVTHADEGALACAIGRQASSSQTLRV